jgi:hypothetical protein
LPTCDAPALKWQGYAVRPNTYLRQDEKQTLLSSLFMNCRPYGWGSRTDMPGPDDYDEGGIADVAVYRLSSGLGSF